MSGLGGERAGPADEYEALRAQLLAGLRRQPEDTRALMRMLVALSRMEAAQGRLSPRRREELSANIDAVLSQFDQQMLPPVDHTAAGFNPQNLTPNTDT